MSLSDYTENKIIDHIFRDTQWDKPTTLYIALLTTACADSDTGTNLTGGGGTGVEVSGGSYDRVALNPSSSSNWRNTQGDVSGDSTGTGGQTTNDSTITFPTASGTWGTIVGVAIVDDVTNGNIIASGTLTINKTVTSGDIFTFQVAQLSLTMS